MSEYTSKYPNDVLHTQKHYIMLQRFVNNEIQERFPHIDSFISKSHWIVELEESNHTATRIANYTSCPVGDVTCAEVFAFQKLIVGPLHLMHKEDLSQRLKGADSQLATRISSNIWTEAPRFDAAVHLRNQFPHFEQSVHADDPKYHEMVQSWLRSDECDVIFRMMRDKLVETFSKMGDHITRMHTNYTVFVAADNEIVKNAFRSYLSSSSSLHLTVVSAASDGVMHIGACSDCHSEQTIRNLAYDWYLMSLSNYFLFWRIGGSTFPSTYSLTAAALAGGTHCEGELCLSQTRQVLALIGRSPNFYWRIPF